MNPHDSAGHRPPAYPTQSWYVAATSDEVTADPLGRRALDTVAGALPHLATAPRSSSRTGTRTAPTRSAWAGSSRT